MKKIAVIGTNIDCFLHKIEDTITIFNNEERIDDSTTEVYKFHK